MIHPFNYVGARIGSIFGLLLFVVVSTFVLITAASEIKTTFFTIT